MMKRIDCFQIVFHILPPSLVGFQLNKKDIIVGPQLSVEYRRTALELNERFGFKYVYVDGNKGS